MTKVLIQGEERELREIEGVIGTFTGTFNPAHLGHRAVADMALQHIQARFRPDFLLFYVHNHATRKTPVSTEQRIEILSTIIEDRSNMGALTIDQALQDQWNKEVSWVRSFHDYLYNERPGEYLRIVSSERISKVVPDYHAGLKIPHLVAIRDTIPTNLPPDFSLIPPANKGISSSAIREGRIGVEEAYGELPYEKREKVSALIMKAYPRAESLKRHSTQK